MVFLWIYVLLWFLRFIKIELIEFFFMCFVFYSRDLQFSMIMNLIYSKELLCVLCVYRINVYVLYVGVDVCVCMWVCGDKGCY